MKRRMVGLILVFVFLFSMSVPAFASEQAVMQQAQLEIDRRVDAAMAAV